MVLRVSPLPCLRLCSVFGLAFFAASASASEEWNQWRGSERNGAASEKSVSPTLPESGLSPLWLNVEDFKNGGGWSSPIVADGKVFQYSHKQSRREGVKLPPEKYPPLTDEQKQKLPMEEVQSYEKNRTVEQRERHEKEFRHTDTIVCLDAATGKRLWLHERDSAPTQYRQSSTPAASNGRLYYVGADRKLVCIESRDGSEVWSQPIPAATPPSEGTPQPLNGSPLATEDRVVVLAGRLIAMDATDGSVLWTSEAIEESAINSSPALWETKAGLRIVANLKGAGTVCVDAADGRELWRVESHAGDSTPVIAGDVLLTYGSSRKGGLRRYDMTDKSAELKWTSNRFADQGSSPVIAGGRVFVQGERNFASLNLDDGEILWQTTLDREQPRYTSPIAVADTVFYTFGGVLCVSATADDFTPEFDARINETGVLASEDYLRKELKLDSLSAMEAEQVWNRKVASQGPQQCVSPAFADGRLYLRLNRGLVCYDLQNGNKTASKSP
jgi:outer membrane protein assembly factor BamB